MSQVLVNQKVSLSSKHSYSLIKWGVRYDFSVSRTVWDLCNLKVVPNEKSFKKHLTNVWDLCNLKVVPNHFISPPLAEWFGTSAIKFHNQRKNECKSKSPELLYVL